MAAPAFDPTVGAMARHTASRIVLASPRAVFRAFIDPEVVVKWRAPADMDAKLQSFEPRVGGGYRMELTYRDPASARPKSTPRSDIVDARFVELVPEETIVEAVKFESNDPSFAGTMTITTTLAVVNGGTKVTFAAENVPSGISAEDHKTGMEAALKNLANLLE